MCIDLDWIDVYHEVVKGNVSWDDFQDYLINLEKKSYNEGYEDGCYSEQSNTDIIGE
jgi:hypothetical protein